MEHDAQERVDRWMARANYRSKVGRWPYWAHRARHILGLQPGEVINEERPRGDGLSELWVGFRCALCGEVSSWGPAHNHMTSDLRSKSQPKGLDRREEVLRSKGSDRRSEDV